MSDDKPKPQKITIIMGPPVETDEEIALRVQRMRDESRRPPHEPWVRSGWYKRSMKKG